MQRFTAPTLQQATPLLFEPSALLVRFPDGTTILARTVSLPREADGVLVDGQVWLGYVGQKGGRVFVQQGRERMYFSQAIELIQLIGQKKGGVDGQIDQ